MKKRVLYYVCEVSSDLMVFCSVKLVPCRYALYRWRKIHPKKEYKIVRVCLTRKTLKY